MGEQDEPIGHWFTRTWA